MRTSTQRKTDSAKTYRLALAHWRRAEFSAAQEALESVKGSELSDEAVLLLGRILTRRSASEGASFFEAHLRRFTAPANRAWAVLFLANAYARCRDYRKARARFTLAKSLSKSADFVAALGYFRGAAAFYQGDSAEAGSQLQLALGAKDADTRVLALLLQAAILAHEERYVKQVPILVSALEVLDEQPEPNVELLGYVLENMAVLAREIYEPSLASLVEDKMQRPPWTPALERQQFVTLKAIGWWKALQGDYFNAFRLIRQASSIVREPAWRVVAKCDLAYLADCLQETHWSSVELNEARELAETVHWESETTESIVALLLLAELYAPSDTARAVQYLSRYRSIEHHMSPAVFGQHDRRLKALADRASAIIEWKLGNRSEAVALLEGAYDTYSSIGYDWRAGRAATDLARLTGNAAWARRARQKLERYQKSWLYRNVPSDLSERATDPNLRRLTPAQRRVFDLVVAGKSNAAISRELQRSLYTVKNHVRAIFDAFRVGSRAELLAKVARES